MANWASQTSDKITESLEVNEIETCSGSRRQSTGKQNTAKQPLQDKALSAESNFSMPNN